LHEGSLNSKEENDIFQITILILINENNLPFIQESKLQQIAMISQNKEELTVLEE